MLLVVLVLYFCEDRLDDFCAFFQGAHYEDSIVTFKQLIASYPQTAYTDLAYTYAIQSMVKLELYTEASELINARYSPV